MEQEAVINKAQSV
ncbi:hypothetical protein EC93001_5550, partial [Escherichia coli 93-001]